MKFRYSITFMAVSVFIAIGAAWRLAGYYMWHVPIEYAYVETVAIPLALLAIYFQYFKKRPQYIF